MGQYWLIVCLDREETKSVGKLGEFFNDRRTNAEVEALARPLRALPQIPRIPNGAEVLDTQAAEGGSSKLPPEMFYHIAADVAKSTIDLINFASACHLFWDICRPLIEQNLKARTWAGSRIICVGDYMDDLPPDILSDVEKYKASRNGLNSRRYSLYDIAGQFFVRPTSVYAWIRTFSRDTSLPGAVRAAFACMLPVDYKSTGKPAVLRNLSKKLFVHSEAVDTLNRVLRPNPTPKQKGFCLGDALMSRACWSSDPSRSMGGPADLTRGPWAGDRFDVILAEEFEMQSDHAEWKDASKDVCSKLGACWEDW